MVTLIDDVLLIVVVAAIKVPDVKAPNVATYCIPVLMLAMLYPFESEIKIDRLSVGFVLIGFEILEKSTVASKSGDTYVSHPFVNVTELSELFNV